MMCPGPAPSELTPESGWLSRRTWLATAGAALLPAALAQPSTDELTPFDLVSRHNNYAEFSPQKDAIWKLAEDFQPRPWTLRIDGEVERPQVLGLDDLLKLFAQEDRVYRMRCVEGWSAVVPWRGFPLAALLARVRPLSSAKYVEFVSVMRPEEMVGQRRATMAWPYREGLRIDEAMHPLALVVTGLYGKPLPSQNGAPLRMAVPWKYGFKGAKAIVHIRLVETQPLNTWAKQVPSEYGFYGNVNPEVPHPRWAQRREVRLGELHKRPTLPFNGYAAEVAPLYAGMDLARHF